MRVSALVWGGLALTGLLAGGCGGPNLFVGILNGAFYEPTGTVWGHLDAFTHAPGLQQKDPNRFIVAGSYASFDPNQDQATLAGSSQAELRDEIARNDWFVLTWDDAGKMVTGQTFVAVARRDDANEFHYRAADTTATDATAGFSARVRFRRGNLPRGAAYDCPVPSPPLLCQDYRPLGSRVRVEVELSSANRAQGGAIRGQVTIKVERADGDPEDAQTGTLTGNLSAQVVPERISESNMDLLELYDEFGLSR